MDDTRIGICRSRWSSRQRQAVVAMAAMLFGGWNLLFAQDGVTRGAHGISGASVFDSASTPLTSGAGDGFLIGGKWSQVRWDVSRDGGLFRADALRETARQAQNAAVSSNEAWPTRHPVLLGTLIGAGTGLIIEQTYCGLSSCYGFVAAAVTGAGAYGGLVASAVHKAHFGQPVSRKTKVGLVAGAVGAVVGSFLFCYGMGGCGGVS